MYIYSVKSVININRQEVHVSIIICCMFMFYLSSFIFCHCSRICLDIHTVTRRTVSGFDGAHWNKTMQWLYNFTLEECTDCIKLDEWLHIEQKQYQKAASRKSLLDKSKTTIYFSKFYGGSSEVSMRDAKIDKKGALNSNKFCRKYQRCRHLTVKAWHWQVNLPRMTIQSISTGVMLDLL